MIESLDSVWFFSNVMSSKKIQALGRSHGDEDDRMNSKMKICGSKLEQSKPITQILETHQAQSPMDEILVPKLEEAKPITQILETQQSHFPIGEIVVSKCGGDFGSEERKRSKTRARKKKNTQKNTDGINWGGYDFGFGLDVNEFWMLMKGYDEERRFTSQNLPPFSDGLAMKQHLKSWAYAVACNVR